MRLLSALLDAALLPLDIAVDIVNQPVKYALLDRSKSRTRERIEKIEDEISGAEAE